jgi:hypothetical protein
VTGETPIPEIAVGHLYELQSEPQPVAGFPKLFDNHVNETITFKTQRTKNNENKYKIQYKIIKFNFKYRICGIQLKPSSGSSRCPEIVQFDVFSGFGQNMPFIGVYTPI